MPAINLAAGRINQPVASLLFNQYFGMPVLLQWIIVGRAIGSLDADEFYEIDHLNIGVVRRAGKRGPKSWPVFGMHLMDAAVWLRYQAFIRIVGIIRGAGRFIHATHRLPGAGDAQG